MIKVKNESLKKKIFKKINKYENLALREYKKGNIKKGKSYEKIADRLYKNNYYKMFEVKR